MACETIADSNVTADEALLARWNSGERKAGEQLIRRHTPLLREFFRKKSNEACDDLLQQTWLAIFAGSKRFTGSGSFRSYLFGVARFVLFEHIRRNVRRRSTHDQLSSVKEHSYCLSIHAESARRDALMDALNCLPSENELVLRMAYWQQLTADEIAAQLAVPASTVYMRMFRAKRRLKAILRSS